jgi:Legume lectin domain
MAFVIQTAGTAAIGHQGGGLGYGGRASEPGEAKITPSVDIEFDTFLNPWDPTDPHIAVTTNGRIESTLAWAKPEFPMFGSSAFSVWISYDATSHILAIYASQATSQPATPAVKSTVDLASALGALPALVGFTGGTGDFATAEDILSWHLTS